MRDTGQAGSGGAARPGHMQQARGLHSALSAQALHTRARAAAGCTHVSELALSLKRALELLPGRVVVQPARVAQERRKRVARAARTALGRLHLGASGAGGLLKVHAPVSDAGGSKGEGGGCGCKGWRQGARGLGV